METLQSFNAFCQYLWSKWCLGLTSSELSHHPSSYSQFVIGPGMVVTRYEIKLPRVKVNGSDTGSDFRKESMRPIELIQRDRFLPVVAAVQISPPQGTCTGSSRASDLNMLVVKKCLCVDSLREECAVKSARVLTWTPLGSGVLSGLFSTFQLCHFLKLLSTKSPKQTNPFLFMINLFLSCDCITLMYS